MSPDLRSAIDAWLAEDPDPATTAALQHLLSRALAGDAEAEAELASAFAGPLEFGTAGLRGPLGAGPARMNRLVVSRAAGGLAAHLHDLGAAGSTVVVGHDARYNSDVFARDTCEVLAGAGFDAVLVDEPTPTPVIAFAIRQLGASAGVVVTASHNPPEDNGYKVYLGDGSQIVPPSDVEIAARIAEVAARPIADLPRSSEYRTAGPELLAGYVARAAGLVPAEAPRDLRWAYTPLHGVGARVVDAVVSAAGFSPGVTVAEQARPDPDFPTVSFPNPEEAGAIDLALELGRGIDADVVIANDPDADRCAVACVVDGGWRMLRGDELGALLADDALRRGTTGVYACSVVSSTLLGELAAAHGQPWVQTLTGFKWIGRVPGLVFGYEEAIGYCCDPAAVADKDGITALVRVLALVAQLRADGLTVADRLDEIVRSHGLHETDQLSVRVSDLSIITDAMARLRAEAPTTLLGEPVTAVDLAVGSAALPPTDGLLYTGDSVRVVVRPSGTEPKLKCYLQVVLSPADSSDPAAARDRARTRLSELRAELSRRMGL